MRVRGLRQYMGPVVEFAAGEISWIHPISSRPRSPWLASSQCLPSLSGPSRLG